ncbi:tail assembly chaperone, partial [Citrobacter freundii]
ELMLGEISDDDRAKLSAWMTYKRSIKTVSCNDAISYGFVWPEPPIE